jgi:alpha-D-xyloside xylohydrolase
MTLWISVLGLIGGLIIGLVAGFARTYGGWIANHIALVFIEIIRGTPIDRQYMLGDSVLVAPVFSEAGDVQFYLPEGRWTHLWHNDQCQGSRWHKQQHDFRSLPVYVRDNTLLALGNNNQKPDYAWSEGTAFQLFNLSDGATAVSEVPAADGSVVFTLKAIRSGNTVTVKGEGDARGWTLCLRNVQQIGGVKGASHAGSEWGVVVKPEGSEVVIHL